MEEPQLDFARMLNSRIDETNIPPGQVDYIVIDCINDQCGPRQDGFDPDLAKIRSDNINVLLQTGEWTMAFSQHNTVILRRVRK